MLFHAKLLPSCPILYDPMDCSPPGSSARDSLGKNFGVGYWRTSDQEYSSQQSSHSDLMEESKAGQTSKI